MDHKRLRASLTVEAAAVMGVVLTVLGSLILTCFRLHDRAMAENRLYYTIELFSHRNPDSSEAEKYRQAAEDTGMYVMKGNTVRLSSGLLPESLTGSLEAGGKVLKWKNPHLRGEDWLRCSTLEDFRDLPETKKKKTEKERSE